MRGSALGSLLAALAALAGGCWDEIVHQADCGDQQTTDDTAADADADGDADAAPGDGQGDVPPGWEGFGAPCVDDADCNGYPGTDAKPRCCLTDVLGIVNAPGGFCTACCNAEAIDGCAENIDCVGLNDNYLICLAHCDAQSDCRLDEGWECRPIWYMDPEIFPGNYCLPDADHVAVDTDQELDDPNCPWPWL